MIESFDFDAPARRFNVLKIGRMRIGWWTVPTTQIARILYGHERMRIWTTTPRRT